MNGKTSIHLIATATFAIWAVPAFSEETKPRSIQPTPTQTVERPFGGPHAGRPAENRVPIGNATHGSMEQRARWRDVLLPSTQTQSAAYRTHLIERARDYATARGHEGRRAHERRSDAITRIFAISFAKGSQECG